jgi:hypothetical protein
MFERVNVGNFGGSLDEVTEIPPSVSFFLELFINEIGMSRNILSLLGILKIFILE